MPLADTETPNPAWTIAADNRYKTDPEDPEQAEWPDPPEFPMLFDGVVYRLTVTGGASIDEGYDSEHECWYYASADAEYATLTDSPFGSMGDDEFYEPRDQYDGADAQARQLAEYRRETS